MPNHPAGLLHDTVEDCGDVVGLDEINFHFGSAVRRIVEGETKFRCGDGITLLVSSL